MSCLRADFGRPTGAGKVIYRSDHNTLARPARDERRGEPSRRGGFLARAGEESLSHPPVPEQVAENPSWVRTPRPPGVRVERECVVVPRIRSSRRRSGLTDFDFGLAGNLLVENPARFFECCFGGLSVYGDRPRTGSGRKADSGRHSFWQGDGNLKRFAVFPINENGSMRCRDFAFGVLQIAGIGGDDRFRDSRVAETSSVLRTGCEGSRPVLKP